MSDFEERLTRALGDGASATGAAGLVAGARRRAAVRRRRRGVVVAVVAVLAVAVPVGVVAGGGPREAAPVAPTTSVPTVQSGTPDVPDESVDTDGLREVVVADVIVAVPSEWVEGPLCPDRPDRPVYGPEDACAAGVSIVPSTYQFFDENGLARCDGPGACVFRVVGDTGLLVRGLDRAETDRVYESIRPAGGTDWVAVAVNGISIDLPPGWARCSADPAVFVPAPGRSCDSPGPAVAVQGEAALDFDAPVLAEGSGAVVVDTELVTVDGMTLDDTRRILASARPVTEPAVEVSRWHEVLAKSGVRYVVPEDERVEVRISGGVPRCAAIRSPARRVGDHWEVGLCRNRIVTVVAPTQALASIVALHVSGW